MDYSFWFATLNLGWSIVYIEGSQVIIYKQFCISCSEDHFCLSNQVSTLVKCCDMQNFIWVFIVCQRHLGVRSPISTFVVCIKQQAFLQKGSVAHIWALTRDNLTLFYVNNKGSDQPAQTDQRLCYWFFFCFIFFSTLHQQSFS